MKMYEMESLFCLNHISSIIVLQFQWKSEALIIPLCFLHPSDQKVPVMEMPPARLQRILSQVFGVSTYRGTCLAVNGVVL